MAKTIEHKAIKKLVDYHTTWKDTDRKQYEALAELALIATIKPPTEPFNRINDE